MASIVLLLTLGAPVATASGNVAEPRPPAHGPGAFQGDSGR
ncbi:hypothetical protein ACWDOR_32290 [Streptosporangium canum]